MSQLKHLIKWDFVLLARNQIILISGIVTIIYIGIFQAIKGIEEVDKVLVLIIFNDPALLGFIFVGVSVLFEKNENTLQALVVSPLKEVNYILSKTIALTLISLGCCLIMALAAKGPNFQWVHYSAATIGTTALFGFVGFILISNVRSINEFILKSALLFIVMGLPFLGYFEVIDRVFFLIFPAQPAIDLFNASFVQTPWNKLLFGYMGLLIWNVIGFRLALRAFRKNIKR